MFQVYFVDVRTVLPVQEICIDLPFVTLLWTRVLVTDSDLTIGMRLTPSVRHEEIPSFSLGSFLTSDSHTQFRGL